MSNAKRLHRPHVFLHKFSNNQAMDAKDFGEEKQCSLEKKQEKNFRCRKTAFTAGIIAS